MKKMHIVVISSQNLHLKGDVLKWFYRKEEEGSVMKLCTVICCKNIIYFLPVFILMPIQSE